MRRPPSGAPEERLMRGRTPPSANTGASSPGAPGPGTATPGRRSTSTRAALCARTPGKPRCTGGGYAPDGTSSEAQGKKLALLGEATDWQPRCLWECGLMPAPSPDDCPPNPPAEADCGKPRQCKLPGTYLIYTDASAMRPKDPYLRRAACALWAGDHESESEAWALPGPVQTVYRAELYAILVALRKCSGGTWRSSPTAKVSWTKLSASETVAESTLSPGTPTCGQGTVRR